MKLLSDCRDGQSHYCPNCDNSGERLGNPEVLNLLSRSDTPVTIMAYKALEAEVARLTVGLKSICDPDDPIESKAVAIAIAEKYLKNED